MRYTYSASLRLALLAACLVGYGLQAEISLCRYVEPDYVVALEMCVVVGWRVKSGCMANQLVQPIEVYVDSCSGSLQTHRFEVPFNDLMAFALDRSYCTPECIISFQGSNDSVCALFNSSDEQSRCKLQWNL